MQLNFTEYESVTTYDTSVKINKTTLKLINSNYSKNNI